MHHVDFGFQRYKGVKHETRRHRTVNHIGMERIGYEKEDRLNRSCDTPFESTPNFGGDKLRNVIRQWFPFQDIKGDLHFVVVRDGCM